MDRDEFMELVYETFADEPDNVLANGIIEAADAYAEHEKEQLSKQCTTSDLISRQAAIDAIENSSKPYVWQGADIIRRLSTIQPEPSIPLTWIGEQIERLRGMDNAFATLTAMQISGMLKKWRDKQGESN